MSPLMEEILENLVDLSARPHRLVYQYIPKEYTRNHANVTIHRLERQGWIEKGLVEDEICIRLTELGLKKINEQKQKAHQKALLGLKANDKWDGKWRVVVFDIPEGNRRIRNTLRQTLKVLEFRQLQKSVWISKRNLTRDLRIWIRELGISPYVLVFETKDLGDLQLQ